jgi:hypothetical protein
MRWSEEREAASETVLLGVGFFLSLVFFGAMPVFARAESLSCVSTTFQIGFTQR